MVSTDGSHRESESEGIELRGELVTERDIPSRNSRICQLLSVKTIFQGKSFIIPNTGERITNLVLQSIFPHSRRLLKSGLNEILSMIWKIGADGLQLADP
jgi:hypothetical protein